MLVGMSARICLMWWVCRSIEYYSSGILYPDHLIVSIRSLPSFFLRLAIYTSRVPSLLLISSPHNRSESSARDMTRHMFCARYEHSMNSFAVHLISTPSWVMRCCVGKISMPPGRRNASAFGILFVIAWMRRDSSSSANGFTR